MNPFSSALRQLERARNIRPFSEDLQLHLTNPNREIRVSISVRMDDGCLRMFEGYRVQYNNDRGPYKGGIRFHEQTDIEEVKALAFWMTLKTAVVGIPMGGGKGGVTVNPKTLSEGERERLSRGWMRAMTGVVGPQIDVPAPDVNTDPQIMAWMADEYAEITGDRSGAVITGKPVGKGGSEGRGIATAQGGLYVFEALRERAGLSAACTVAIQGFGNAGETAARLWDEAGYKIVAVSDSRGAIYQKDGLNLSALHAHKENTGSVMGFAGAQDISNDELLILDVDVLIPAALEHQIHEQNAHRVKAKMIFELANGPTTPEADDVLFEKGVVVVPDILANAGGVTVSYFEWEQNLQGEHWTEADVLARLKEIMANESERVWALAEALNTDLRRAAFLLAIERIEQAK